MAATTQMKTEKLGIAPADGSKEATPYSPGDLLTAEAKDYVANYLRAEIKDVLDGSERTKFVEDLNKWRRMAMAKPEQESKSYPWQDASNIVTPIMAQKQNTIYAKLIAMFSSKRPFWSCISEDQSKQKHADAIALLMNFLAKGTFHLNIDRVNRTLMYDLVLHGTQPVRVPWTYSSWPVATKDENGNVTTEDRVMHNGPSIVPIRLEDFIIRSYYDDIQKAPWVGIRTWLTHAELKQREADGIYAEVDSILAFYQKELTADRREELERRGFAPSSIGSVEETRIYPIIETYVFYDADGDGVPEDIKVWIEVESGVILRSEANTLGARDITVLRYFQLPYQMMGLGIGHFLERLQDEADFLHNHRIDNLHFSLIPAYKRRRGSSTKKQQTLHPGAIIDLDDINDLVPLITPDLTGSTYQSEMLTRDYADRVSGANDPMSGYADTTMKSGADVGSTLFLAEQGNSILNAIYDGIENDYSEIGQLVLMQLVANKDRVDLSMLSEEDAALVSEVLQMPVEVLPTAFTFRIETTDQSRSEETKRQTLAQAAGMYASYGQQMMQLTAVIDNPQIPPQSLTKQLATRMFIGGTDFVKQAMKMMKVGNEDILFPDTTQLELRIKEGAINAQSSAVTATGQQPAPMAAGGNGFGGGMGGGQATG